MLSCDLVVNCPLRAFRSGVIALSQSLTGLPLRTLQQSGDLIAPHAAAWAREGDPGNPVVLQALFAKDGSDQSGAPTLWFGIPADGSVSSLLALLPEAERLEIGRLRSDQDRWSVAAARAAARILLSQLLDCPARDISLIRSDRGKPRLDPRYHGAKAKHLHFSISHTKELVAVAIGRSPIGIDVEAVREFPDMMQVARMQFAREMLHDLLAVEADTERAALFFRFWTLGEAFIKATGEGIAQGLQSFSFPAHGRPALTRVSELWGPPGRWCFGTLGWGMLPLNGYP
ncbi:4'-phosphopantetheinyl transferase family protein [Hyphomicrobium sp.]|uniref:4'-phosphopantetheinyl transferase family protein n=1 Tax=Hyphomicrobium sp. TaxID=82 RepID=UPI003FA58048